jgi:SAM-dependent methyltransferase
MATSLRDPNGHVCLVNNRVIRVVNRAGLSDLQAFLNSAASAQFLESQRLVNTRFLDPTAVTEVLEHEELRHVYEQSQGATIVEHDRVSFPSFPYEWPAEMLHAAAALTLDFAEKLLDDGLGLKDASPYNVLFRGPQPVFVDLLSFEPRNADDPTWLPFAQFVRTFLLPLLVNKHFGFSLTDLLTTHRDGLEPEEVLRLLSPLQKLRPPFLTLVSIPAWLSAKEGIANPKIYQKQKLSDPAKARFILRRVLHSMRRKLAATAPRAGRTSPWSDYMDKNDYSQDYFPLKQAFVSEVMREQQPKNVLDVGCNTGHFSAIAARAGASVVAVDYDPVVVGEVWRQANAESLDILPLVVNLARPTPGIGWRNAECASFLERARGQFDAVLMLGVIHHLLVSERIPLAEVISLAAELTADALVIEFVAPDDPMFRRITRGADHLYTYLTKELFEETCGKYFDLVCCERLDQTSRWLYLMKKKEAVIECFETQQ